MDTHQLVDVPYRQQRQVEEALQRFLELAKSQASGFGTGYLRLWETIERNMAGGKQFRPRMVMTAYEGLGGEDVVAAAHVAAAYEMLHTALIVHDDVIDRDFVRRGGPNVSGSYRDLARTAGIPLPLAEHRGMSVAVIAGDLALSAAYRLIDRAGSGDAVRTRLREILDDAVSASAAGELADVDFTVSGKQPSVEEIIDMERLKTAFYSFEAPLQSGAVLAGAPDATVDALAEFGKHIGIAYQIVDDVLGVFGDEGATGKSTIGDLREGKLTVMIAYASDRPEWQEIENLFGDPALDESGAVRLRDALVACGAKQYAQLLADEHANRAWEQLASDAVPAALRDELRPIVAAVLERAR
ncbi:polyprenyl synthetase family protein [Plantibacter sp. YIM 135249]|uniref:polyprenyl synthetase family protein n=1 Tax=Plantibacter sp. YIM 135249 TaxID=3423918 RepID=UPI003D333DEF